MKVSFALNISIMKKIKILYTILAMMAIPFVSLSQEKTSSFSPILSKYYELKDALIKSDATAASTAAASFSSTVQSTDVKALNADQQSAFTTLKNKLVTDANAIAGDKNIAKQRSAFQTLSQNMITLAKAGTSAQPAYVAYCPMKKAYWLSAEQAIKNPYYGNSMLTCGKVSETID